MIHIDDLRCCYCLLFIFLLYPICCPRTILSPSLPVVTQIQDHIAGPLPSPLRHVPSFSSREDFSIFFPRRLASNGTSCLLCVSYYTSCKLCVHVVSANTSSGSTTNHLTNRQQTSKQQTHNERFFCLVLSFVRLFSEFLNHESRVVQDTLTS